ncbi:autophagy-related protein 101-like [Pomacea canaliculata]|uniref:autophagy-related protein 101-like n=1 Tax=Pomacea canaliculata TaxID=400727 RepID=UPI000D73A8BE|nr:autophagy-related protein 101-like [Pomacea canaliculata]
MNARSHVFELDVLGRQIEEVAQCIFHTLLIYRSVGKMTYTQEAKYSSGTLGFVDVDCDFIDLTYVRLACDHLDHHLKREISSFRDALRVTDGPQSGEICLEFYQKKRARWPFQAECIPWELWTLKMDVINLNSEHERNAHRQNLGVALAEKIMFVADNMSHHQYVPKTPNQNEVDLVFDTGFDIVQPYLFRISHQEPGASVGNTMRKFLKDTLML